MLHEACGVPSPLSIKTVRSPRLAATVKAIKPCPAGTLKKRNVGRHSAAIGAALCIGAKHNLKVAPFEVNIS